MSRHAFRYPDNPGWKDSTASRDNALAGRKKFGRMKLMVLGLYGDGFIGTADKAAERLAISPFSCRPRCTELLKLGLLERVRIDRSIPGSHAWVLRLARQDEEPPYDDGQPGERQEWHDYDPDC